MPGASLGVVRLLFCGSGWLPLIDVIGARLDEGDISVWDRSVPLVRAVAGVHVILPSNARIDAELIAAASELMLIQQPAAGYDGVDIAAARARDIPVCNAPGANHDSVAETATYLMLALARRAPEAARAFAAAELGVPRGHELRGKSLGLIGYGRSARAFARIAAAIGMTVESVDSKSTAAELRAMVARADVISIHCPLNADTHGLVSADLIGCMKPGAFIINCARGPIIERQALTSALESGALGGAGLDTFWREPWDPGDPLFAREDVVTLPHVAGSSFESFDRIAGIVCENIRRVSRGEAPLHRVG